MMAGYRPCAGCLESEAFRVLSLDEEPQFCLHCLVWLPAMSDIHAGLTNRVSFLEPNEWLYWSVDAMNYLDDTPPYMIEDYLVAERLLAQAQALLQAKGV